MTKFGCCGRGQWEAIENPTLAASQTPITPLKIDCFLAPLSIAKLSQQPAGTFIGSPFLSHPLSVLQDILPYGPVADDARMDGSHFFGIMVVRKNVVRKNVVRKNVNHHPN
jgi:hypothetical protein